MSASTDAPADAPVEHGLRLPTTVVPVRYELVLVPDLERFVFQGVVWIRIRVCAAGADADAGADASSNGGGDGGKDGGGNAGGIRTIVLHSADLTYELDRFVTAQGAHAHAAAADARAHARPAYSIHVQPYNPNEPLFAQTSAPRACTSLREFPDAQRVHLTFGNDDDGDDQVLPLLDAHEYVLRIVYEGVLNDQLCGFYRSQYKCSTTGCIKHTAVTQFEATDARRALPCWDEPALKAVFDVTLVCPDRLTCVSNMPVTRRTLVAGAGAAATAASAATPTSALQAALDLGVVRVADGLVEYVYAPSPVMSTYLLAFVVGEFEYLTQHTKHGVEVRIYTPPGKLHLGDFSMHVAVRALEYFVDYFGIAYPLPKVDLLAIADFAAGAMENWGCITYRESALLIDPAHSSALVKQRCAKTVCHELAHMWFGNLVTMEWWTYLWLNEGFARFMEQAAADHIFPDWDLWTQFIQDVYAQAQRLDALETSHAVEVVVRHQDEINEIFDLISYAKGASLIRMLNDTLGRDAFERGVRTYLQRHLYGNATTEDLWRALADESGVNVSHMMDQWVKRVGYPVLRVSEVVGGASAAASEATTTFHVRQEVYLSSGKRVPLESPWIVPIRVGFHRVGEVSSSSSAAAASSASSSSSSSSSSTTSTIVLEALEATISVPVPTAHATAFAADPASFVLKFNHHQSGFFLIEYDDALFARIRDSIESLPPIDRLGVLRDTFASAIAGRVPMSRALDLMHRLRFDENFSVVSALADNVSNLMSLHGATAYKRELQQYVGDLFAHTFDMLGWSPAEAHARTPEGHITSLFRSVVIGGIAQSGRTDVAEHAFNQLAAFHANPDASPIAADLRPHVYALAIHHAGDKAREILLAMFAATDSAEEKQRILSALGTSSGNDEADKAAVERLLAFAFQRDETNGTSAVRTNELVFILSSLASSRLGRDLTWAYLKSSWTRVEEIFSAGSAFMIGHVLSGVLAGFSSASDADDVHAFFAAHPCLAAERTIQQCEESVRARAARLEREQGDVRAWLQSHASEFARAAVREHVDLQYHEWPENEPRTSVPNALCLDLYVPVTAAAAAATRSSLPALFVYLHGGLWMDRDKRDYALFARTFASRGGVAVACVNYRMSSAEKAATATATATATTGRVLHPMHTQDVAHALAWLSAHASTYGYDASRVVLFGHSCGAHMAGLLTLDAERYFVRANDPADVDTRARFNVSSIVGCVGCEGLYDLHLYKRDFADWARELEHSFTADRTRWDSPVLHRGGRSGDQHAAVPPPPWLVLHSRDDAWVNRAQPDAWVKHLRSLGEGSIVDEVELRGGHFEVIEQVGREHAGERLVKAVLVFLSRLLVA